MKITFSLLICLATVFFITICATDKYLILTLKPKFSCYFFYPNHMFFNILIRCDTLVI